LPEKAMAGGFFVAGLFALCFMKKTNGVFLNQNSAL